MSPCEPKAVPFSAEMCQLRNQWNFDIKARHRRLLSRHGKTTLKRPSLTSNVLLSLLNYVGDIATCPFNPWRHPMALEESLLAARKLFGMEFPFQERSRAHMH